MSAYSPIAVKAFGSELISTILKLSFARSLILSRLLFNVHTTVPTARDTMAYNGVYMRVLRHIAGDARHGHAEYTDIQ
eukprot:1731525-Heterocapsa_arctica.AAC.1